MKNQEIAKILYKIADYLDIEEVSFRPKAYRRAALALETLKKDVREIYKQGRREALEGIPGIGKSIAEIIEEYLNTGKVKYYEQLKKKLPINFEGVCWNSRHPGPRRV